MKTILMMVLLILVGCGKKGNQNLTLQKIKTTELPKFINQKPMPKDPNLTLDKSIVNNTYPIQIALYANNRFYYDLPNLGDGTGTWEENNGVIELKAKRSLFNMFIEIMANDEEAKTLSIQFSDRFGPNTLKMVNVNI